MPENAQKSLQVIPDQPGIPGTYPDLSFRIWLFGFASKKYHPLNDLDAERWDALGMKTWYYTTNLHRGAFMLPKYVEDLLEEEETR